MEEKGLGKGKGSLGKKREPAILVQDKGKEAQMEIGHGGEEGQLQMEIGEEEP